MSRLVHVIGVVLKCWQHIVCNIAEDTFIVLAVEDGFQKISPRV